MEPDRIRVEALKLAIDYGTAIENIDDDKGLIDLAQKLEDFIANGGNHKAVYDRLGLDESESD